MSFERLPDEPTSAEAVFAAFGGRVPGREIHCVPGGWRECVERLSG